MRISTYVVNSAVKVWTHLICRIDAAQLNPGSPESGPLILVTNHVTSLEVSVDLCASFAHAPLLGSSRPRPGKTLLWDIYLIYGWNPALRAGEKPT